MTCRHMKVMPPARSGGPSARRLSAILPLAAIVASCAPAPQVNPSVNDTQVAMIEVGQTTHKDILRIVGPPDTVWETERIWVFEEGPMRHLVLLPPGHLSAGASRRLGADLFFIRFDEGYRVEKVGRLSGPSRLRDSYGDLLRAWLDQQESSPGGDGETTDRRVSN